MEPRDPTIGERIMLIRRRRGLTQRELAALAQMATTALHRLENGVQSVYAECLATLARVLNVSADYLLGLRNTAALLGATPPVPAHGMDAGGSSSAFSPHSHPAPTCHPPGAPSPAPPAPAQAETPEETPQSLPAP